MRLYARMAWRNIWRNTRRSLLTMAAICFATMLLIFMLSLQFGNYRVIINSVLKLVTGHLQVQARGYQDRMDMRLAVADPEAIGRVLEGMAGINGYTFRANSFSLVSSRERTYGVRVTGIEAREGRIFSLPKIIRQGRFFSDADREQALVGSLLAKNLQVRVGDELAILGQGWDGSIAATVVKVLGIISSGQDDFDRSSIYIPLLHFQEVYTMRGGVHEVVVDCTSLDSVPQVKQALTATVRSLPGGEDLAVLDWQEIMPGLMQAIKLDLMTGFLFYFVLIIVVAFGILNTFLMTIFERKREFGVMMALGCRPGRITEVLALESIMMTAMGSCAGLLAGLAVTYYFQIHGITIPGMAELAHQFALSERLFPLLSVLSVSVGTGLVLGISILTAFIPVLKVRRLRPLQAMASS